MIYQYLIQKMYKKVSMKDDSLSAVPPPYLHSFLLLSIKASAMPNLSTATLFSAQILAQLQNVSPPPSFFISIISLCCQIVMCFFLLICLPLLIYFFLVLAKFWDIFLRCEKVGCNADKRNPYVAFRRRFEKMQTRKNRKLDENNYVVSILWISLLRYNLGLTICTRTRTLKIFDDNISRKIG